jgi:hypothetical protein
MRLALIRLAGKTEELVEKAKSLVAANPGKPEVWRAYVSIEYAILDLKLRHRLEHAPAPPKRRRKDAASIDLARSLLDKIDPAADTKKLLYDLRECRDVLKSLMAAYDRRSTMS